MLDAKWLGSRQVASDPPRGLGTNFGVYGYSRSRAANVAPRLSPPEHPHETGDEPEQRREEDRPRLDDRSDTPAAELSCASPREKDGHREWEDEPDDSP